MACPINKGFKGMNQTKLMTMFACNHCPSPEKLQTFCQLLLTLMIMGRGVFEHGNINCDIGFFHVKIIASMLDRNPEVGKSEIQHMTV